MNGLKREVLGIWAYRTMKAPKFWMQIVRNWKSWWSRHLYRACVDRLKGFPEAIKPYIRRLKIQLCIVHLVRHSRHVFQDLRNRCQTWKWFTELKHSTKPLSINKVCRRNGTAYPIVVKSCANWAQLFNIFFCMRFAKPFAYDQLTIESLNMTLRKDNQKIRRQCFHRMKISRFFI